MVRENTFESGFYGLPVLELRLEVADPGMTFLTSRLDNPRLYEAIRRETASLLGGPVWKSAYLYARLVEGEPLHRALSGLEFREVERRSIYGCRFRELHAGRYRKGSKDDVCFCTLADLPPGRTVSIRKQIIALCREAFSQGFSRHFTDSCLLSIRPGIDYIQLVMENNFVNLEPGSFLVALTENLQELCAFSVVGSKPGLAGDVYTQLLSAVSLPWRGQGIYGGFADLLSRNFPADADLLNVTHTRNRSIRSAYSGSGRRHIADTVILRRVFEG